MKQKGKIESVSKPSSVPVPSGMMASHHGHHLMMPRGCGAKHGSAAEAKCTKESTKASYSTTEFLCTPLGFSLGSHHHPHKLIVVDESISILIRLPDHLIHLAGRTDHDTVGPHGGTMDQQRECPIQEA